jgi:hypothetical protein
VPKRPITAIKNKKIPQNIIPPRILVATMLIELAYIATDTSIVERS